MLVVQVKRDWSILHHCWRQIHLSPKALGLVPDSASSYSHFDSGTPCLTLMHILCYIVIFARLPLDPTLEVICNSWLNR